MKFIQCRALRRLLLVASLCALFKAEAADVLDVDDSVPAGVILHGDRRVRLENKAVGRLVYEKEAGTKIVKANCTAWIIANQALLTAGHCFGLDKNGALRKNHVLEFDVPPSSTSGKMISPDNKDRYRVIDSSVKNVAKGKGNDWAIFQVEPSIAGRKPLSEAGRGFFRLLDFLPSFHEKSPNGDEVVVGGYGADRNPPGQDGGKNRLNATLQQDSGKIAAVRCSNPPGCYVVYYVDTEHGNSGSPVFYPGTNVAVAIHTGGDDKTGNWGTLFSHQDLKMAINQYLGVDTAYVDGYAIQGSESRSDGSFFAPFRRVEDALLNSKAAKLAVVTGYYAGHGLVIDKASPGSTLTIQAIGGPVILGAWTHP